MKQYKDHLACALLAACRLSSLMEFPGSCSETCLVAASVHILSAERQLQNFTFIRFNKAFDVTYKIVEFILGSKLWYDATTQTWLCKLEFSYIRIFIVNIYRLSLTTDDQSPETYTIYRNNLEATVQCMFTLHQEIKDKLQIYFTLRDEVRSLRVLVLFIGSASQRIG